MPLKSEIELALKSINPTNGEIFKTKKEKNLPNFLKKKYKKLYFI